ncbi:uncharacterized protein B0H18DRAFT_833357, partial [Fomitopsis serialis]|uniref:uncharacterized protein n=1 Tax=Fomitopsis serialis TaxID=139415 RepID=UPI00200808CD
ADCAGMSIGSVFNCSRRCMVTILGHHDVEIKFCDEEQMQQAKLYAEMKSLTVEWRDGDLAADGTPIKLYTRPGFFGLDFYGKDKIYAIQLTVSCQF